MDKKIIKILHWKILNVIYLDLRKDKMLITLETVWTQIKLDKISYTDWIQTVCKMSNELLDTQYHMFKQVTMWRNQCLEYSLGQIKKYLCLG